MYKSTGRILHPRLDGIYEDPLSDDIGKLIAAFQGFPRWTTEKRQSFKTLHGALKKSRYKSFIGHPHRYGLGPIGDSYFFDVPSNRRGFLSKYRGRLVRIIVTATGRFDRGLMVGAVDRSLCPKKAIPVPITSTHSS
jgi:hypothetical protein